MNNRIFSMVMIIALLLFSVVSFAEETPVELTFEEPEKEWVNILLLGGDSRSTKGYARTDCMMIVSFNREESLMKLTSIMRDTWVKMPGMNKSNKINAANVFGGPELSVQTVNEYFGTDIEDYVLINMNDLVDIIDIIGGIDIEIESREVSQVNKNARDSMSFIRGYEGASQISGSGMQHLNGLLATAYARNRYSDNDYYRVMRQQKVILAIAQKLQDMDVDELMSKVDAIRGHINTSMDDDELKDIATAGMVVEIADVEQFRIPADGTFQSGMFNGIWMIRPDFEENAELLHDFIYGQDEADQTETETIVD